MITLTLHKDGKKEVIEREDANLIELEAYFDLQEEIREGIINKKIKRKEIASKQSEFIARLFKDKNVTLEDLKKGWKAKEFNQNCTEIFKQISPSDYETDEEEETEEEKK